MDRILACKVVVAVSCNLSFLSGEPLALTLNEFVHCPPGCQTSAVNIFHFSLTAAMADGLNATMDKTCNHNSSNGWQQPRFCAVG